MKKPSDHAIHHPAADEGRSLAQAAGKCKSTTDIIDLLEQTATLWGVSPRALWPMVLPEIQRVDWLLLVHLASLEKERTSLKPRGPNPTLVKAWLTPALASHIEQAMIAEYYSLVRYGNNDSGTTTWALWLEAWRMAGHGDSDGPLRDHLHRLMVSPSDVWAGPISAQLYSTAIESLSTPDQCLAGVAATYLTSLSVQSFMAHPLSGPKTLSAIVQNLPPSSTLKEDLARAMWAHPSALVTPSVREWMLSWPWAVGQYALQLPCWPRGSESSDQASFLIERAIRGDIVSQHPDHKNKYNGGTWTTPEVLGGATAPDLFGGDDEARQRVQAVISLDIISQLAQSPVAGVRLATQMQLVPLLG